LKRYHALVDQPDLAVTALLAVLGGLGAIGPLDGAPAVRALVTLPLTLFLPGYAFQSALLPRLVIPAVERLLLSLGISIVLAVVIGLVMGTTSIGLTVSSWAAVLVAFTLVSVIVAWVRRTRAGIVGVRPRVAQMPLRAAALLLISGLIVADVVLGARLTATDAQAPAPVQLWLIPLDAEHSQARLGMRAGPDGGHYRIDLSSAGQTIQEYGMDLVPQQTWETVVVFPPEIRNQPIVARLYEGDSDQESRFVTLQPVTGVGSPAPT
jgi:Protein of unknown function (DUF1616)